MPSHKSPLPPRLTEALLSLSIRPGIRREDILGSLSEEFLARAETSSHRRANGWYRRQAIGLIAREMWSRVASLGRELGGGGEMSWIVLDLKFVARTFVRRPMFALTAIATLAVGIGANTAVFSVINGVLLKPLPYGAPEDLVRVTSAFPASGFEGWAVSPPEYFELREWNQVFADVGGYRTGTSSVETYDRPVRVPSAAASWSFFPTMGVSAALGRTFTEEEDLPGAASVAMISDGLWRRAFGEDRGVIGRTVRLDGVASTIVGVMPPGFDVADAGVDVCRWYKLKWVLASSLQHAFSSRGPSALTMEIRRFGSCLQN